MTRLLEPTGSSVRVSGVVTGLRGQITGSWIAMGLTETSNTLLEIGQTDDSTLDLFGETERADSS